MTAMNPPVPGRDKVTVISLAAKKAAHQPIVMVTAYDYSSAGIAEEAGVDVVLVGDSAANVMLGHDSTVPVTVDEMLVFTRAVRRGVRSAMVVADLPFGSYEVSDRQAVRTAQRFVKDGGADAIKLERGGSSVSRARAVVEAGISVMGHVGLTPQAATTLGGYRAQGRTAAQAEKLIAEARELQDAGCFAIVVEAVPADVAELMVPMMTCPVIGIGAGAATDGQVLVWHDLLGLTAGRVPKFVRQFADLRSRAVAGVGAYAQAVRSREFPAIEHTYSMSPVERDALRARLGSDEADGRPEGGR